MIENRWPSIAIVTPSLNQSRFLAACISSVLNQKYEPLQYAIVDGGSTDGSVEIIKANASSLQYWRSHRDEGHYAAIAEGFANTNAEVLGWINSDDILLPWTLHTVGGIFRDCPEVEWVTTEFPLEIDAEGLPIAFWRIPGFNESGFRHRENLMASGSPPGASFIQQESTFWRRTLWEKAGGKFDKGLKFAADFELWDRFFDYARLYSINLPLAGFRRHNVSQISIGTRDQYLVECEAVLSRHGDTTPIFGALLARRAMMIGLDLQKFENRRKAIYLVRRQQDSGRYFASEQK